MSTVSPVSTVAVRGLEKRYGEVQALHGITFSVHKGEIVGFLGPNGAGKSTTMKILTCYQAASAGEVEVCGLSVVAAPLAVRQRIGYLPESVPLYEDMIVWDYLSYMAKLRGVPARDLPARVEEAIRACALGPVAGRVIEELSKGYRQRVGLAQALVHRPEVLILDEPMNGLDPHQIIEIRELIRSIGRERTVLLSTHILQEIEALCDRVLIIDRGRLVADGRVAELYERVPGARKLEDIFLALTGGPAPTPAAEVARDEQARSGPAPTPAAEVARDEQEVP